MKKNITFIMLFINSLIVFSQSEKMNWIIFIDGKIPLPTVLNGEFIYFENTTKEKIVKFEYLVGDIQLSKDELNYIKNNGDSIGMITMKLYYKEFGKHTQNLYIYSFEIPPRLLLPMYDYVVFRITNLDKKKGFFYFGYSTSYESTIWLNKEEHLFNKINTKIPKRGINSREIKMRRVIISENGSHVSD